MNISSSIPFHYFTYSRQAIHKHTGVSRTPSVLSVRWSHQLCWLSLECLLAPNSALISCSMTMNLHPLFLLCPLACMRWSSVRKGHCRDPTGRRKGFSFWGLVCSPSSFLQNWGFSGARLLQGVTVTGTQWLADFSSTSPLPQAVLQQSCLCWERLPWRVHQLPRGWIPGKF